MFLLPPSSRTEWDQKDIPCLVTIQLCLPVPIAKILLPTASPLVRIENTSLLRTQPVEQSGELSLKETEISKAIRDVIRRFTLIRSAWIAFMLHTRYWRELTALFCLQMEQSWLL